MIYMNLKKHSFYSSEDGARVCIHTRKVHNPHQPYWQTLLNFHPPTHRTHMKKKVKKGQEVNAVFSNVV